VIGVRAVNLKQQCKITNGFAISMKFISCKHIELSTNFCAVRKQFAILCESNSGLYANREYRAHQPVMENFLHQPLGGMLQNMVPLIFMRTTLTRDQATHSLHHLLYCCYLAKIMRE
jgi:hypothetical protein